MSIENTHDPAEPSPASDGSALALAIRFHEAYERLAPRFGYETRPETRNFDPKSQNGRLMVAVCREIIEQNTQDQQPRTKEAAHMNDDNERSVASAGSASADGPTRAEIFAALDTLTRAIGCYGERIARPFVIRWGNGLIAGINGEFEAGGIDNVTSRIARLQGRDWRTL